MNQEAWMAGPREDIVSDLRDRITTGRIAPGSHLAEASLADEYQISRTPIRAALRVLAHEGLVVIEQNRGAFVTEWRAEDAAEVMEIRALIESHAAALAALRRTSLQSDQLLDLCRSMEQLNSERPRDFRGLLAEHNHSFHLTILEAAASPRLFLIGKDLALAPIMSGSFQYYSDSDLARSLGEHRMMAEAIERGESSRARALAETHLRNAYAALSHKQ